jgi:hypothetical protein
MWGCLQDPWDRRKDLAV